jgi:hypothetical protein
MEGEDVEWCRNAIPTLQSAETKIWTGVVATGEALVSERYERR